jgi:hypothetical protein
MQKLQCPICGKEGMLMWKETRTTSKGKTYTYRKLYVYHGKKSKKQWCYLNRELVEELRRKGTIEEENATETATQKPSLATQKATQNCNEKEKPNLSFSQQNTSKKQWAGSLARIGHEPPKLGVAGSNPAPPAILCCWDVLSHVDINWFLDLNQLGAGFLV